MLSTPHCAATVKTSTVPFLNVVVYYAPIICHPTSGRSDSLMDLTWESEEYRGAVSAMRTPFHSCFLPSFQFTPLSAAIIKQTFPHVNYDTFTIPISFSWFLPLKLKLKISPTPGPPPYATPALPLFLLMTACLACLAGCPPASPHPREHELPWNLALSDYFSPGHTTGTFSAETECVPDTKFIWTSGVNSTGSC